MENVKELSDVEEELKEKIFGELKDLGDEYSWIIEDFGTIIRNRIISNKLEKAYIQTAVRRYMNKHGIIHGLTTTYNALKLFKLIYEDSIASDYVKDFGFKKDQVLFAMIVASYIHDIGRFYTRNIPHEPYVSDALEMLSKIAESGQIFQMNGLPAVTWRQLLDRVKELCLCHEKKQEVSEKTEIALVKLADALDCSKQRAYSKIDNPELDVSHSDKMRKIFSKDKYPELLFSCLSVDGVTTNWDEQDKNIIVTVEIKDYAAAYDLKRIVGILKKCQQGPATVRKLSEKVRVIVKDPIEDYTLFPMDTIAIPGGKFLIISYEIDIQNMKGDSVIKAKYVLKNIRDKSGIPHHTFRMWGLKPTGWGKDVKIQSFDAKGRELKTRYERSVNGKKGHIWTVIFPKPIKINQGIEIKGHYIWKKFVKVKSDEFARIVRTPTDCLECKIYFPEKIRREDVEAHFELKKEETIVFSMPLNILYDKERNKAYIHLIANDQQPEFIYRVFWKIKA